MNPGNQQNPIDVTIVQRNKFVGRNRDAALPGDQAIPGKPVPFLPSELRRAAQMLGINPSDISTESVYRGWRKQMSAADVHPDLGGETETAVLLNTAKDDLLRWLEARAPKLGKRFPSST